MQTKQLPSVFLVMKPVDGGRAMIGLIECPNCGQDHFTTDLKCGERKVFCGTANRDHRPAVGADGYSQLVVTRIL